MINIPDAPKSYAVLVALCISTYVSNSSFDRWFKHASQAIQQPEILRNAGGVG